ncbi:uncharacterized protein LOC122085669 [Macadamia integrifolia]|uniref:uncharacterized protein LOC122085669 n=1 Tax=Macadamia integrifolia TaxID=60698 RepID=UPI001C4E817F|nr:uncharacterized protein LOC122085669 [Macadamia integrifolia]XP_042510100.1 uncharacterized protein LOC122085669 [Macadamia integrifolia]
MSFESKGFWVVKGPGSLTDGELAYDNSSRIEPKRTHQWFIDGSEPELFPNKKPAIESSNNNSVSGIANVGVSQWENTLNFQSVSGQFSDQLFGSETAGTINFGGRNIQSVNAGNLNIRRKDVEEQFGNDPSVGLSISHTMEDPGSSLSYGGFRKVKINQVKDSGNGMSVSMGQTYNSEDNVTMSMGHTNNRLDERTRGDEGHTYSRADESVILMGHSYSRGNDNPISMGLTYGEGNDNTISMGHTYNRRDDNAISMGHTYSRVDDNTISMGQSYSRGDENISMGQVYDKGNENTISMGHNYKDEECTISMGHNFIKGEESNVSIGHADNKGFSNTLSMRHIYNKGDNSISMGHIFNNGESTTISFGGYDEEPEIDPSGRLISDLLMSQSSGLPVQALVGKELVDSNADLVSTAQLATSGAKTVPKNKMELKTPKKLSPNNFPSNVKSLLSTGMLDGVPVKYISWSRERELRGVIKGSGYLCSCQSCNLAKAVNAYEFERHACCKTKHPNNHIFFENGKTIYGIVQELRSTPQNFLFEAIQTVTGSPINQKAFRIWKESFEAATHELQRIYGKDELQQSQKELP